MPAIPFLFTARIELIGVNPFVFVPQAVLEELFRQAGSSKGKIPVRMEIDGHPFVQTLVRYAGHWRLYLNGPMRQTAGKEVGDSATFSLAYDPAPRTIAIPPKLRRALSVSREADEVFQRLAPSLQQEIIRYISRLKTEASVDRNVERAIAFLLGRERFIGRAGIVQEGRD